MAGVYQLRPTIGQIFTQRFYAANDNFRLAGTFDFDLEPLSPSLVTAQKTIKGTTTAIALNSYNIVGYGPGSLPSGCDFPPVSKLFLVGVLLGHSANEMTLRKEDRRPLATFAGYELNQLSIPVSNGYSKFSWESEIGALNGDFLFQLTWAAL